MIRKKANNKDGKASGPSGGGGMFGGIFRKKDAKPKSDGDEGTTPENNSKSGKPAPEQAKPNKSGRKTNNKGSKKKSVKEEKKENEEEKEERKTGGR